MKDETFLRRIKKISMDFHSDSVSNFAFSNGRLIVSNARPLDNEVSLTFATRMFGHFLLSLVQSIASSAIIMSVMVPGK